MTRRSDPKAAPTVAAAKRDQSQFTHQDLTKDLFGEYTKPEIDIRYQVYSNGAEPLNDAACFLRDIGRKVSPRDREKVLALFEKAHTRQAAAVEHNGAFPDLGKAHRNFLAENERAGRTEEEGAALVKAEREAAGAGFITQLHPYYSCDTGIYLRRENQHGDYSVPLTNFKATILVSRTIDDGVSTRREFEIEVRQRGKTQRLVVAAEDYESMRWVSAQCEPEAIVAAGNGLKAHARAAIQHLSEKITREHVYIHIGWVKTDDGHWTYLDATKARLPGNLARYEFGGPGGIEDVQASLRLLEVAPDSATIPLFASIWRAPLGPADFSAHLYGKTGVGKTRSLP